MITRGLYLRRTLAHHWRANLALGAGAAVACAILTGALLVGDSMRASLRGLARERLGEFDLVLAPRFRFRAALADDLARQSSYPAGASSPVAILQVAGSAVRIAADGTRGPRVGEVSAVGIERDFLEVGFRGVPGADPESMPALGDGRVVLNQTLAMELGAAVGDTMLLSIRQDSVAPLESFLGNRADAVRSVSLEVAAVIPDRGVGLFSLRVGQSTPRLALVAIADLQRAAGAEGLASTLLVDLEGAVGDAGDARVDELRRALRMALAPEDIGLRLRKVDDLGLLSVESTRMILAGEAVAAVRATAQRIGLAAQPVLTHLAARIAVEGSERSVPYSTIAAVDVTPALGRLRLADGAPAPSPEAAPEGGAGDILLDAWAAEDLGLDPASAAGTPIVVEYFVARPDETVTTATASFRLRAVVALEGAAVDPTLTPEFPGITDGEITSLRSWRPPFEMDLSQIDDRDDEYWNRYRAAPKAFISTADGARLFQTRYGPATSIRLLPPPDRSLGEAETSLRDELARGGELPEKLGLTWDIAGARTAEATSGGTGAEFGVLFVSMSFFLIIAAAILVALLFGLQLDRRARECGTLLAQGFTAREVRGLFLAEAAIVGGAGAVVGVGLAAGYAAFLLHGLQTWWADAVRVPYLIFEPGATSIAVGFISTCVVVFVAIVLVARGLRTASVRGLLAGVPLSSVSAAARLGPPRKSIATAVVAGISAAALAVLGLLGGMSIVGAFFGVGVLSLICGLAVVSAWLRAPRGTRSSAIPTLAGLGAGNARRAPGRSLLTVSLVAAATFIVVAVGISGHDPSMDEPDRSSGNGGFALAATTDVPLVHRLDSESGRDELGIADAVDDWSDVRASRFRLRPGDNASCLNLYAPRDPRILGATREFIERGGFRFAGHIEASAEEAENPWLLLERRFDDGAVPVIGDAASTQWILKKALGDDIVVRDDSGDELRLRLVANLSGSLFQGELLMAEERFLEYFPSIDGYRFFLIELAANAGVERVREVEQGLERGLEDFGFDAVRANDLIARYLAVESTYMSIFQLLGGLGLALGTVGLGIVLLRGAIERRGELALMRAVGFRRRRLSAMVLAEDVLLLGAGIAIGAGAALLGLLLRLGDPGIDIPWLGLGIILATVFAIGLISAIAAVASALGAPLLPALRSEG